MVMTLIFDKLWDCPKFFYTMFYVDMSGIFNPGNNLLQICSQSQSEPSEEYSLGYRRNSKTPRMKEVFVFCVVSRERSLSTLISDPRPVTETRTIIVVVALVSGERSKLPGQKEDVGLKSEAQHKRGGSSRKYNAEQQNAHLPQANQCINSRFMNDFCRAVSADLGSNILEMPVGTVMSAFKCSAAVDLWQVSQEGRRFERDSSNRLLSSTSTGCKALDNLGGVTPLETSGDRKMTGSRFVFRRGVSMAEEGSLFVWNCPCEKVTILMQDPPQEESIIFSPKLGNIRSVGNIHSVGNIRSVGNISGLGCTRNPLNICNLGNARSPESICRSCKGLLLEISKQNKNVQSLNNHQDLHFRCSLSSCDLSCMLGKRLENIREDLGFVPEDSRLVSQRSSLPEMTFLFTFYLKPSDRSWLPGHSHCPVECSGNDSSNNNGNDKEENIENIETQSRDNLRRPKNTRPRLDDNIDELDIIRNDNLIIPIVLSATDRVYNLSSGAERSQAKSRLQSSHFETSHFVPENVDNDGSHTDLRLPGYEGNVDKKDVLTNSFDKEWLSLVMANAGLSDKDIEEFLSSDTAVESAVLGNSLIEDICSDIEEDDFLELVCNTTSDSGDMDVDSTQPGFSESSDIWTWGMELAEQSSLHSPPQLRPAVANGHQAAPASISLAFSMAEGHEQFTWCDSRVKEGRQDICPRERCVTRLIDASETSYPKEQSNSTVLSFENSELYEYIHADAIAENSHSFGADDNCGFSVYQNHPDDNGTEVMDYIRDQNEPVFDDQNQFFAPASGVAADFLHLKQNDDQNRQVFSLINYSDDMQLAATPGRHSPLVPDCDSQRSQQTQHSGLRQKCPEAATETRKYSLRHAQPGASPHRDISQLTWSEPKRKRATSLARNSEELDLKRKKLKITLGNDSDDSSGKEIRRSARLMISQGDLKNGR